MKLINYNSENSSRIRNANMPYIRVSASGLISFSPFIAEKTGIKHGTRVDFFQSEEDARDWYFAVTNNVSGFTARQTKSKAAVVNCSSVAKKINDTAGKSDFKSVKYKVSLSPVAYNNMSLWLIVISSAQTTSRV